MESKKQKNCYIEILRFVFTLMVIVAHYKSGFDNHVLQGKWNGHIGVEFFFVLSGFLMTAYCARNANGESVPKATWIYMKRKCSGLAPIYFIVLGIFLVRELSLQNIRGLELARYILALFPSIIFLPAIGMNESMNIPYSWYIGAMMLGIFVLFPLVYRYKKTFTQIFAPLIVILFCAWAMQTYGKIMMLRDRWLVLCFPGVVRGIGDLCMGIFAYEICDFIKTRLHGRLTEVGRWILTFLNIGMFSLIVFLIIKGLSGEIQPTILVMFGMGVALTFSGVDCTGGLNRFPFLSRIFCFAGTLSLPFYLGQGLAMRYFPKAYIPLESGIYLYVALCLGIAVLIYGLSKAAVPIAKTIWRALEGLCIKS